MLLRKKKDGSQRRRFERDPKSYHIVPFIRCACKWTHLPSWCRPSKVGRRWKLLVSPSPPPLPPFSFFSFRPNTSSFGPWRAPVFDDNRWIIQRKWVSIHSRHRLSSFPAFSPILAARQEVNWVCRNVQPVEGYRCVKVFQECFSSLWRYAKRLAVLSFFLAAVAAAIAAAATAVVVVVAIAVVMVGAVLSPSSRQPWWLS